MENIALMIYCLNSGGAERVVTRLYDILSKKYNVYIILFNPELNKYEGNFQIIDLGKKEGHYFKAFRLIERANALKQIKKEYHIHTVISFLAGPNFVNLLARGNDKAIISVRNFISKELAHSFTGFVTRQLVKLFYNHADYIVPVSKIIAEDLVQEYHIKKEKIVTIYNPYNRNEIQEQSTLPLPEDCAAFFQKGPVVLSVGRLMYQKGFWHLVKAFRLVLKKIPDARLAIVGEDYQNGKLAKLCSELLPEENVLLAGYRDNPYRFMKNADLYVMPSLFEGFPNALVEAMMIKKPVIAADCKSGPREILYSKPDLEKTAIAIEEADFGILIPPMAEEENYNPASIEPCDQLLAEAILKTLQNPDYADKMAQKAELRAADFNYEKCFDAYSNLINDQRYKNATQLTRKER